MNLAAILAEHFLERGYDVIFDSRFFDKCKQSKCVGCLDCNYLQTYLKYSRHQR